MKIRAYRTIIRTGESVWRGVIAEYKEFIDLRGDKVVTLLEGGTPLIPSRALTELLREWSFKGEVYFKHEGFNPTSSFKDRGMTVAVSKALEDEARAIICASTGNTSASAAAYGARAGIPVFIVVPKGTVALGKLCQAMGHGARIVMINGTFDIALKVVREIAPKHGMVIVNSINPWRVEGQKTASFEICDILGRAPDYHILPVGNAANIAAYWKGYVEYREVGKISNLPKMMGFQAEGAAPIVRGHPIEKPQTIASAIRIGNPANWEKAVRARDESGGIIDMVSDREIIEAYRFMGTKEGIFCEPASSASVAGLIKSVKNKIVREGIVVCTLTGHGLKDPDSALRYGSQPEEVPADHEEVEKVLNI